MKLPDYLGFSIRIIPFKSRQPYRNTYWKKCPHT